MQNDKIVVGLDIGTTKVCAIVGKLNTNGQLEILGVGKSESKGVVNGNVFNIDRTTDAIIAAVKEAEQQSNINIKVVNVGIAGQHVRSLQQHGVYVRPHNDDVISVTDIENLNSNMYRTLVPAGRKIIHVIPQDYLVDSFMRVPDPVGSNGSKIEADFQVVMAEVGAIKNIELSVKRAGLIIDDNGLMLEPIASSMSALTEEEKETGVVLVDIGGGTTDVAVFYKDILRHVAVIPFGGNVITADIKTGCMVLESQAELLKTRFGHALEVEVHENSIISIPGSQNRQPKEVSMRNLASIIEARVVEIIELVHREIIYSGYERSLIGGIVITGGGAQLKNMVQLVELVTGLPTRIGEPTHQIWFKDVHKIKDPMYATAVGLTLAGFQSFDSRVNNYQARYGQEVKNQNVPAPADETASKSEKKPSFWDKLKEKSLKIILDDDINKTDNTDY
ncbi:cell division protein FtsA [Flexibacter flexilis DSM 6793]|uniref:Cell division protein FtsA n=1 Tax=Flexibacter flexilis DSM 6793 TaxID=927664 RepID=A0A1I1MBP3_9BACT|nr:cell division protein FtsA [Flexibacter flexilis]SFC80063.1 cell division protein FtsA [Flexibacter flexilis DSM 6793]